MINLLIDAAEKGFVPELLIRTGIKSLVKNRLFEQTSRDTAERETKILQFAKSLKYSPIAIEQDAANSQHYEVPSKFYDLCLGPRKKYSSCYWPEGTSNLEEAEILALEQIEQRANIEDGQEILDLGCGWGSFSLWAAARYPNSKITSISNSSSQAQFIQEKATLHGLNNITTITADIASFSTDITFDRIVSIEMLEHFRNYELLFQKISSWMKPDAKFFVHIFCNKDIPYFFEVKDNSDWMSKHFFTGGVMPSHDLFRFFQNDLVIEQEWKLNGTHYQKTAKAWLDNLDSNYSKALSLFEKDMSTSAAKVQINRWRIFFMACEELFGFDEGKQWFVSHYKFTKK